jgi:hypothetical protein
MLATMRGQQIEQPMTDAGIIPAFVDEIDALRAENVRLKAELARWKPSECGKIFPWPRPGEVVIHCVREPDHDGAHHAETGEVWVFAETSQT